MFRKNIFLTALVFILIGFVFGFATSRIIIKKQNRVSLSQEVSNNAEPDFYSTSTINTLFAKENFRTLKVVTFGKIALSVVAQKQWTEGYGSCGGFSESPCYFFIEPLYISGAPSARFVAMYDGNDTDVRLDKKNLQPWGGIDLDSIRIKNDHMITFNASEGGGGGTWALDLQTNVFTPVGIIKPIEDGDGGF